MSTLRARLARLEQRHPPHGPEYWSSLAARARHRMWFIYGDKDEPEPTTDDLPTTKVGFEETFFAPMEELYDAVLNEGAK